MAGDEDHRLGCWAPTAGYCYLLAVVRGKKNTEGEARLDAVILSVFGWGVNVLIAGSTVDLDSARVRIDLEISISRGIIPCF